MGSMACNAIELGFIRCCSDPNGVFRSRVPKVSGAKIEYHQFLKCLWLHHDFSAKKREWLIASNQPYSIRTMTREADVCYGRIQFRGVVGSVGIMAESARYIDGFMNILTLEF